jgi:hypothetical protein
MHPITRLLSSIYIIRDFLRALDDISFHFSAAFFRRTPDWCRHQAETIGEEVKKTVAILIDGHALYHLRQVHGIIRLKDKYGKERLNAACTRANAFGDPAYRTVKNKWTCRYQHDQD